MPRMDEKKLHIWEFQLKRSSRNMRCKLLQKRFTGKTTEFSKHLRHIAIGKDILSKLNRCIFQIPLNYIKLVIPKILFILVICSFVFYFKITWPPPPPTKLKFLILPSSKDFSEIFNPPPPPPSWRGDHPESSIKLNPLIQNRAQQDYIPESYATHLPSYEKCPKIAPPTRCGLFPLSHG